MHRPPRFLLRSWPASIALALAACGGAGSDDLGLGGSGGSGGTGTAQLASLDKIVIPTTGGRSPVGNSLRATNDGVYVKTTGSSVPDVVMKRTLGRGSAAGWLSATLPGGVSSYAPTETSQEGPDVLGIAWNVAVPTSGSGRRYGYSNINNGGIAIDYLDNLGFEVTVADGDLSPSARDWAVSGNKVYRKATGGGVSTASADRYTLVATLADTDVGEIAAAADNDGTLYAASGATLYKIPTSGTASSWDLSSLGFGNVHTLVWRHGRIWVGYADKVLYANGTSLQVLATLQNVFTLSATAPKFCISGTTLYGSDGRAWQGIDLPGPGIAPRNWLQSSDNVAPGDAMKLGEMKSALGGGIFCADATGGFGPYVYSLGLDLSTGTQKLFMMTPR
jgi:hypothetical protein